jgi:hypothetical protein
MLISMRKVIKGKTVPNKAFSERHPETVQNASFSRKIAIFRTSLVLTTRRSLVENDRLPSFQGAPDGAQAPRVTQAVGQKERVGTDE